MLIVLSFIVCFSFLALDYIHRWFLSFWQEAKDNSIPPFLLDQLPLVTYKYREISYYYPEAGKSLWLRLLSALRPISPERNGMPQYILWQLISLDGLVFSLSTTVAIIHTSYCPTNVLALGSTTHILFHMNFQRPDLSSGIQKQSRPKMIKQIYIWDKRVPRSLPFQRKTLS